MTNIAIQKIKEIINGNDLISKDIMTDILKKYSIKTDILIENVINTLIDKTLLYWEPLIKTDFFQRSENRTDPHASVSNYHFLRGPYSDKYEVTVYGNRESKMIRCINTNKFYIIAQKLYDDVKDVEAINNRIYEECNLLDFFNFELIESNMDSIDSFSKENRKNPFYNFDAIIKREKTNITTEDIKNIIIECFQDLFSEYIDQIINEYLEAIKNNLEKYQLKLDSTEKKLKEVSDRITQNTQKIRELNYPGEDKFEQFRYNYHKTKEISQASTLPSKIEIEEHKDNINEMIQKGLDEKKFDIEQFHVTTKDNKIGWPFLLRFTYGIFDILSLQGEIKYFQTIPDEATNIMSQIKDIITKIKIETINDERYQEQRFNSMDYDSSYPKTYFTTCGACSIKLKFNDKEISYEDLEKILDQIELLLQRFNELAFWNMDITNPEIVNRMKNNITCQYNFDESIDINKTINEKIIDKNNWKIYGYGNSMFDAEKYQFFIRCIINSIKNILVESQQNQQKAQFYSEYSEYFVNIHKAHSLVLENNELLKQQSKLQEEKNETQNEFDKMDNNYSSIKRLYNDTNTFTKK